MSQTPTPSAATGTNTNPKGQTPKENVRSLAAGLLNRLDVITLGEGNESAGVNTVVMMALTIANLSPPGSYLEDDAGCRIHVGMNVALGGGLSCGVVSDRVFTELQKMQGNFLEHIRLRMKYKDKEQQRLQDLKAAGQRSQDGTLPMMLDYLASSSGDMLREPGTGWHSLLQAPIHPELDRSLETPAFFSKAGSVEALDTAVRFANYGRLLTHTAIHCRQDLALLEKLCREAALGNPNAKLLAAGARVANTGRRRIMRKRRNRTAGRGCHGAACSESSFVAGPNTVHVSSFTIREALEALAAFDRESEARQSTPETLNISTQNQCHQSEVTLMSASSPDPT